MMAQRQRSDLQSILEELLGNENVYYQPGENTTMVYPAIVFSLDDISSQHADNLPYVTTKRYQVTHITRGHDTIVVDKLTRYPSTGFERAFRMNGLYHTIFNITF